MDSQTRLVIKVLSTGIVIGFILGKFVDIDISIRRGAKSDKISPTRAVVSRGKAKRGTLELCYFENRSDMRKIEKSNTRIERSNEQASEGRYSLKCFFPDGGGAIGFYETLPRNWEGYKTFTFDVYSEEEDVPLSLFVKDRKNTAYYDRYNKEHIRLQKGWNSIEIPIEAIDRKLKLNDINHVRLFLWKVPGEHTLYFDNIRLIGN